MISAMFFCTVCGVMSCSALNASCLCRRRSVPIARRIDPVMRSPVHDCLAAHVARCAADGLDQNPRAQEAFLVGIEIATSDTSGMSRPSRSRLMPMGHRTLPRRRSRMISTRSTVSMSECR